MLVLFLSSDLGHKQGEKKKYRHSHHPHRDHSCRPAAAEPSTKGLPSTSTATSTSTSSKKKKKKKNNHRVMRDRGRWRSSLNLVCRMESSSRCPNRGHCSHQQQSGSTARECIWALRGSSGACVGKAPIVAKNMKQKKKKPKKRKMMECKGRFIGSFGLLHHTEGHGLTRDDDWVLLPRRISNARRSTSSAR